MKRFYFVIVTIFSIFLPLVGRADVLDLNSASMAPTSGTGIRSPEVLGTRRTFFISPEYDYQRRTKVDASLRYVSDHAYFYVADNYWSAFGLDFQDQISAQLKVIANDFDRHIYPLERGLFGSEFIPGIDGDPRVTLLFTPLIDYAGGYFDTTNQFPKSTQVESNEREMIYLNVASLFDTRKIETFISHELQHLISFAQKDGKLTTSDDTWINELRSEFAIDYLGFHTPLKGSNLERRLGTFRLNPSDSLTEWKNTTSDYAQILMLGAYIADRFSSKVIADTIKNSERGINGLNIALKNNGFQLQFTDVFIDWMVANFLNDPVANPAYGYKRAELANVHVDATNIFPLIGDTSQIVASGYFKDWEQHWYDLSNLPKGEHSVLSIQFSSPSITSFLVPYIVYRNDGSKTVYLHKPTHDQDTLYIDNVGADVYRVVLMPFTRDQLAGFTADAPAKQLSLFAQRISSREKPNVPEPIVFNDNSSQIIPSTYASVTSSRVKPSDFGLAEGDFIRAEGDNDIFIINNYGYKRLVLNPEICLQYGHLSARGCFASVRTVTSEVRDAFETSHYYTNGETGDGIVYRLDMIDDDRAKLVKVSNTKNDFALSYDSHSIFLINTKEKNSYQK